MESNTDHLPFKGEADARLTGDERWLLVQRIIVSRSFAKAPQLREILLYICRHALLEPGASIKEQEIGCNALGRKATFDPQEDNIVRVQISHIRKRLEEHFAAQGAGEPLRITVPRRSYVPIFYARRDAARPVEASLAETPGRQIDRVKPYRVAVVLLAIFTGLLTAACLFLWQPRPVATAAAGSTPAIEHPFLARVFGTGHPTNIVVADTCLVMLQDILGSDISLGDYLTGQYPEPLLAKVSDRHLRSALQLISSRQYTSLGDINVASSLLEMSRSIGKTGATIRYARHLNIREFKTDNFVLMGSRRGIPWGQLFEPQLNFSFVEDPTTKNFFFRNLSPKAGEQRTYVPKNDGTASETYANIALLPNLGNTGSVLILSGISMEAAEAAGELVVSKQFETELSRILESKPHQAAGRYFEILLRIRAVAGAPRNSQIVTYRIIASPEAGS